jgi:hypothetical protein
MENRNDYEQFNGEFKIERGFMGMEHAINF